MLRAGPFSDERILRLASRRFVPFYFDLSPRGFAGDAAATAFVVKARPEYGGRSVPTPEVLIMTADGKLLASVSNYASADDVLNTMRRALKSHPEFDKPGAAEKAAKTPLERAGFRIDLGDYAGARKELAKENSAAAHYLLGRLARFDNDFAAAERHFAKVDDPALKDDVEMERAYRYWVTGEFEQLQKHLVEFPRDSNRFTEARYHLGLALFHLGKIEKATALWKATIKACSQDPWIYRADWAYCNAKSSGGRRSFSSAGARTSCLNRIGYMGRRNPDLKPRR